MPKFRSDLPVRLSDIAKKGPHEAETDNNSAHLINQSLTRTPLALGEVKTSNPHIFLNRYLSSEVRQWLIQKFRTPPQSNFAYPVKR